MSQIVRIGFSNTCHLPVIPVFSFTFSKPLEISSLENLKFLRSLSALTQVLYFDLDKVPLSHIHN